MADSTPTSSRKKKKKRRVRRHYKIHNRNAIMTKVNTIPYDERRGCGYYHVKYNPSVAIDKPRKGADADVIGQDAKFASSHLLLRDDRQQSRDPAALMQFDSQGTFLRSISPYCINIAAPPTIIIPFQPKIGVANLKWNT